LTRGFRGREVLSAISNTAAASVIDVSSPVQSLKIIATAKALSLTWEAPAHTLTGAPVLRLSGYRVYRSEQPGSGSFSPVGESNEATFLDSHFQFGHTYHYKVRAVFKQGDEEAESEACQPFELTPRDIFPPAAPEGLTALYTVGAVELIWNASLEPDVAGDKVCGREQGKRSQRINKDLVPTPVYRDSAIEAKRHYFYQVTAVDLSGNEGKLSTEAQAETK